MKAVTENNFKIQIEVICKSSTRMSNFVVLKTFPLAVEAEMLRGRLEAEEIRCFLEGDKAASVVGDYNRVNTSWSQLLGGTKVLVSQSDLVQARAILDDIEYSNGGEKTRASERFQSVVIWLFWIFVAIGVSWFVVASAFSQKP